MSDRNYALEYRERLQRQEQVEASIAADAANELPPVRFLDAATFLAWGKDNSWSEFSGEMTPPERSAIIAHARTLQQLAKYERPPVDEAELKRRQDAREAGALMFERDNCHDAAKAVRSGVVSSTELRIQAAYIALCHRDNVTPVPVEEWGK